MTASVVLCANCNQHAKDADEEHHGDNENRWQYLQTDNKPRGSSSDPEALESSLKSFGTSCVIKQTIWRQCTVNRHVCTKNGTLR